MSKKWKRANILEMMKIYRSLFSEMITIESLFTAWEEFRRGKIQRKDVQEFEEKLEQHLFKLHRELLSGSYKHQAYSAFTICDPKERKIHKATVRDRIVHHAVFKVLNPLFEPTFIAHSFSCQRGKGTHKAVNAVEKMLRSVSHNGYTPCFALKCDIRQFFASINHDILLQIIRKKIKDEKVMALLAHIVGSFSTQKDEKECMRGLPIGNLTSQLFANVYMHEFDTYIKQLLKVKNYARYTDDFVLIAEKKEELKKLLLSIQSFLKEQLKLDLHPHKISIRKHAQGIDFLGTILLPHYRALRTTTKRRMRRKMDEKMQALVNPQMNSKVTKASIEQSLHSYLGVLSHANCFCMAEKIKNEYWFALEDRG